MSGKLVLDPDGAATTLTLEGAVLRVLMDLSLARARQNMIASGYVQTRDGGSLDDRLTGTLSLMVTVADRTTLHSWMPDLCVATPLDVPSG